MKTFTEPEMEIVEISESDVIVTSGCTTDCSKNCSQECSIVG